MNFKWPVVLEDHKEESIIKLIPFVHFQGGAETGGHWWNLSICSWFDSPQTLVT